MCSKCSIFCADTGNHARMKFFRRCSEKISKKYLSRLDGFFQENDSSEIGKPPHNFFPAERIASNSRFLFEITRDFFGHPRVVWGNAREEESLAYFLAHMHHGREGCLVLRFAPTHDDRRSASHSFMVGGRVAKNSLAGSAAILNSAFCTACHHTLRECRRFGVYGL